MKIEELMSQIRAGKKVKCNSIPDLDYLCFVEDEKGSDRHEFGGSELYTGFIIMVNGVEWESSINGAIMIADDWELCDG